MQISLPESQKQELPKKDSHLPTQRDASAAVSSQTDCFTQRNSLFNKEVMQVKCNVLFSVTLLEIVYVEVL